tara:strand:- start:339 stop:2540 length:2202 start_codon:yes stop_codon:yes gene_type:complete
MMKRKNVDGAKSQLAKLMATENIAVEHSACQQTASFDPANRVLTLPILKDGLSNDVYDLFVGHEVGHALWTPAAGWKKVVHNSKGPRFTDFVNVTEDARIEKLIKRRFPGIRRSFYQAYKELTDSNFFGTKGRDLNGLNLIDRLNVHAKGGTQAMVSFMPSEQVWVDRLEALETWVEAVQLAEDLFTQCKQDMVSTTQSFTLKNEAEPQPSDDDDDSDGEGDQAQQVEGDPGDQAEQDDADSGDQEGDSEEDSKGKSGKDDSEEEVEDGADGSSGTDDSAEGDNGSEEDGNDPSGNSAGHGSELDNIPDPEVSTVEASKRAKESLVDPYATTKYYKDVPEANLSALIRPWKTVMSDLQTQYSIFNDWAKKSKSDFAKFKRDNSKVVAYLAKEFEMRKAADQYQRTNVSKKGSLDPLKIHSYSFNDDIFKRVATVTGGKNHGLVMYVDWSGSMSGSLLGTVEQVLNLVLFCKKVGIPFRVFAFSDNYSSAANHVRGQKTVSVDGDLRWIEFFSNEMPKAAFQKACEAVYYLAHSLDYSHRHDGTYHNMGDYKYGLSGTPLDASLALTPDFVNKFRRQNQLQIVNVVYLTDGDSSPCVGDNTIVTDEFHNSYEFEYGNHTKTWIEICAARTGANMIGFFLTGIGNGDRVWRTKMVGTKGYRDGTDVVKAVAKNGAAISTSQGYKELYIISNEDLSTGNTAMDTSASDTGAAFMAAAKKKLTNRVVLSKFIDQITG